jgi:8-hydroxy-5-deazaflavin:NADPH oxidoreductase
MNITVIGTGNMARGIATRSLAGGHAVTLVGTEVADAEALASDLEGDVRAGAPEDALHDDIIVLAVPYPALGEVIARYRDELAQKVLVDITNPVDFSSMTPVPIEAGSAAQELTQWLPDTKLVKAFNTTFAGTLIAGQVDGRPLDVFIASDDADAKQAVTQLVEDGGLRAIDAGSLARAHELEALGFLHISIQELLGTSFSSAVKVLA